MEKKKSFAKRSKMSKMPTFKTFPTTIPFFSFLDVRKKGFFRVNTLRLLNANYVLCPLLLVIFR